MKKLSMLFLVTVSVLACHPKRSNDRTDNRRISPAAPAPQFPGSLQPQGEKSYHLSDPNCMNAVRGAANIGESVVHKFLGQNVRQQKHVFEQTGSITSLESPTVSQTIYGHGEKAKCEFKGGEVVCSNNVTATSQPRPLKVCNPKANFDRNSYEGVALTTLSALQKAHGYYKTFTNHDASLPRSQLIVLPVIEQEISFTDRTGNTIERTEFMTDNMAFMPNLVGKPAFIVFPKGRFLRDQGIWLNLNLWESDWVIAHEFGHHIFMHHSKALSANLQSINIHNMPTHAPFKPVKKKKTSLKLNGNNPPFGAINEAFADLFGYFSIGQNSNLIEGMDCFRKGRDVSSANFENGDKKSLDDRVLSIFAGVTPQPLGESLNCGDPVYSEVHAIGALIAHALYEIIRASSFYGSKPAYDPAFGELLLSWPNRLGQAFGGRVILIPEFAPLIKPILIEIASKQKNQLSNSQCKTIDSVLPALANDLKEGLCKS